VPHDLRRTATTMMVQLGVLPDVAEKCLNHTEPNKLKRIYQRASYEGAMRDAWKLLGTRFTLLQDMADGRVTNVVAMQLGEYIKLYNSLTLTHSRLQQKG